MKKFMLLGLVAIAIAACEPKAAGQPQMIVFQGNRVLDMRAHVRYVPCEVILTPVTPYTEDPQGKGLYQLRIVENFQILTQIPVIRSGKGYASENGSVYIECIGYDETGLPDQIRIILNNQLKTFVKGPPLEGHILHTKKYYSY